MKKKVIFFLSLIVVSLSICGYLLFDFNNQKLDDKNDTNKQQESINNFEEDIDDAVAPKENPVENNSDSTISKIDEEVNLQGNISPETNVIVEDKSEISNNDSLVEDKQPIVEKQEPTINDNVQSEETTKEPYENNQEENDNVPEETPKVDEPEIDVPEQEESNLESDPEYIRLKSIYRFSTSQECYNASIDVAFMISETNENFKHTACQSGAYKGQLIGYGIVIYYIDNTTEFYVAT